MTVAPKTWSVGEGLTANLFNAEIRDNFSALKHIVYGAVLGDGANVIPSGAYVDIPYVPSHVIIGVYVMSDASGSVALDIRAAAVGTVPSATICGTDYPDLSSAQVLSKTSFTGWTLTHGAKAWRIITRSAATTIKQVSIVVVGIRAL